MHEQDESEDDGSLTEAAEARKPVWQVVLEELIDAFPQIAADGSFAYIIDGGTAVNLLRPGQRSISPHDIDMICFDDSIIRQIKDANHDWYDVHGVRSWLMERGIRYTPEGASYLYSLGKKVTYNGKEYLVLDASGVAASKTFRYGNETDPRPKDLMDILLLDVPEAEIDLVRAGLKGQATVSLGVA